MDEGDRQPSHSGADKESHGAPQPSYLAVGRVDRRSMWLPLLRELLVLVRTAKGGQARRLSDLLRLPDEELAELVPEMDHETEYYVAGEHLFARRHPGERGESVLLLSPGNVAIYNMFNGRHTIRQIAAHTSSAIGWSEEEAFERTRQVFLELVAARVCWAANR